MPPKSESQHPDGDTPPGDGKVRRAQISQSDVPSFSLNQAVRVPRAIAEHFGHQPTRPLQVAKAMNMVHTSGNFRSLCGAAVAYGIAEGGAYAQEIGISPLGLRIVRPTEDGDDLAATRQALLRPVVVGKFLQRYDGSPLPREDIGINVLQEMGVPHTRARGVLELIVEGADSVGFIVENKGKRYVDLKGGGTPVSGLEPVSSAPIPPDDESAYEREEPSRGEHGLTPAATAEPDDHVLKRRVFITHGKNKDLLEPIKKLLGFGELEAIISVEKTSVSQPVPDKVIGLMRSCGAAIIHVDAERDLFDPQTNESRVQVNDNVLIEIGAAMGLFGRRFILLVREGVALPSNLQGLFEVRYSGETLDMAATIKLMEAINDIKNHPLPSRYPESASRPAGE